MKMKIVNFMLLLSLVCGCAQEKPPVNGATLTSAVEGVGIPGYLEIGMRLDSIPNKIADASYEPNSRASLFWWFGETWRKHPPWGKPMHYRLELPSIGVTVIEAHPTNAIEQIHFNAKKDYDWPYFSGTLNSGLTFTGTNTISLAEVMARYGEPLHTIAYGPVRVTNGLAAAATIRNYIQRRRQQEAILESGESVLMCYGNGEPYRLHYPARGIYFDIQNKQVHSFRIFKKVEPQGGGYSPPAARSSKPTP